jgi:hypothetical protein
VEPVLIDVGLALSVIALFAGVSSFLLVELQPASTTKASRTVTREKSDTPRSLLLNMTAPIAMKSVLFIEIEVIRFLSDYRRISLGI